MLFPAQVRHIPFTTALFGHIHHVVFLCSQKQVGRVYARRVVASMADKQTLFNRAICQLKRKPVGKVFLPAETEVTIPPAVCACGPVPALVCAATVDLLPKRRQRVAPFGLSGNASTIAL